MPDHWKNIIEENPQMYSIVNDSLTDRVYPNIPTQNDTSEHKILKPDDLALPWNERHWNVFVTSVLSTVDVWGRLIGTEYSVCCYCLN